MMVMTDPTIGKAKVPAQGPPASVPEPAPVEEQELVRRAVAGGHDGWLFAPAPRQPRHRDDCDQSAPAGARTKPGVHHALKRPASVIH